MRQVLRSQTTLLVEVGEHGRRIKPKKGDGGEHPQAHPGPQEAVGRALPGATCAWDRQDDSDRRRGREGAGLLVPVDRTGLNEKHHSA